MKSNYLKPIRKFIRPTDKRNKQSQQSIYLRVQCVINGITETFEISAGEMIPSPKDWNKSSKEIRGNSDASRRANNRIRKVEDVVEQVWDELQKQSNLSKSLFQAEIYRSLGRDKECFKRVTRVTTIIDLFNHCIEIKKNTLSPSRLSRYDLVKGRIIDFVIQKYGNPKVAHNVLDRPFYYEFRNFLLQNYPVEKATVEGLMKVLKAVVNEAYYSELIEENPFISCKSEKVEAKPRSLSWEQYIAIENYPDSKLDAELLQVKNEEMISINCL